MTEYLSIKEAAGKLGVTPQTLRNWDKAGKLKSYRNPINNYRMYKTEEIVRLFKKVYKVPVQMLDKVSE